MTSKTTTKTRLVWDLPLRIFHWLLVAAIVTSWITAELGSEYMLYHLYSGYVVIGLLAFRLVWGFVGTRHAQFSQFFPTPKKVLGYIANLRSSELKPSVGHNPLGALMTFFFILLLIMQAVTGLFLSDDVFTSAPYQGVLSEDWESLFNKIHHTGFDILLIAIVLHIAAVLFYLLIKKSNLIWPMITGKKLAKDVSKEESISGSKITLAIFLVALITLFVYWLVVINAPEVVVEDFYL